MPIYRVSHSPSKPRGSIEVSGPCYKIKGYATGTRDKNEGEIFTCTVYRKTSESDLLMDQKGVPFKSVEVVRWEKVDACIATEPVLRIMIKELHEGKEDG